jgi:hypothetical protein
MSNLKLNNKPFLPKLKGFVNTKTQWDAYTESLDFYIELYQKKLEQSADMVELHKAQGAIHALRQLKYLRDEVNAE